MNREEYLGRAIEFASRGSARPNAVLNADLVRWIRTNKSGFTAKQQAAEIGCHYRTVEKVRHYETWGHIA